MTEECSKDTFSNRLGVGIAIIAFVLMISSGSAVCVVHYSLNNTGGLNNSCGTGDYDMTNFGATGGSVGAFSEAYDFEVSSTDFMDTNGDNNIDLSNNFTIMAWLKPESTPGKMSILSKSPNGDNGDIEFMCGVNDQNPYMIVSDGASSKAECTDGGNLLNTGEYSHIACVMNGTYMKLYHNGTLVEECAFSGTRQPQNTDTHIGVLSGTGVWYVDGIIDEVFGFDEYLTQEEINNTFLYNNISGVAVCAVDFSPLNAEVGVADAFTGTRNAGCGAFDGDYYWNFTNDTSYTQNGTTNPTSQTFNNLGQWIGQFTATIGGVNYTKIQNITIGLKPIANFTISTAIANRWPGTAIQFNDTSYDVNSPLRDIDGWYWDFGDGNASVVQNATNTFVEPGEYEVCLIAQNNLTINSTEYCDDIVINGFSLDVFDETTVAAIINWNVTISNSTYSQSYNVQNNTFTWSNFSVFPTGEISIFIEANGYVPRYYYGNFSLGSYINLDAYLLDAASGVYTTYYVRDKGTLDGISNALISWSRFMGSSWVTVEQKQTDSIGTALSYLSPYHNYRLTVSHPSYVTYTSTSYLPTSTTIIIYLNSTTTTTNLVNRTDYLYVDIAPYELVISNGTNVTMTINAPDGNLLHYSLWIDYSNGTNAWSQTIVGSPSGGQIEFNTSNVVDLVSSSSDPFYAVAVYNTGSDNETSTRTYYIAGIYSNTSMASGMSAATSAYGPQTLVVLGILILMFVIGTASRFGYGSSVAGYVVVGALMYFEWFPQNMIEIPIIAVVGSIFVLGSRRLD